MLENIPFTATHTHIAYIWECPPPGIEGWMTCFASFRSQESRSGLCAYSFQHCSNMLSMFSQTKAINFTRYNDINFPINKLTSNWTKAERSDNQKGTKMVIVVDDCDTPIVIMKDELEKFRPFFLQMCYFWHSSFTTQLKRDVDLTSYAPFCFEKKARA